VLTWLLKCERDFVDVAHVRNSKLSWIVSCFEWSTRAVQKVSCHFEYLVNRSRGRDVTWQPVKGDLSAHLWTFCHGTSQSAVRRRWLSLCTVWPSHSQISSLSTAIWEKPKVARSQIWAVGGGCGIDLCYMMLCQKEKALRRVVEWAGALSWWSWSTRSVVVTASFTPYTSSVNGVLLPTD